MADPKGLPTIDQYEQLFLEDVPLLDVRAPVEFAEGAFPTACNLPLMENDERHAVGVQYKQAGQASAIALGYTLVSGETRDQRIERWVSYTRSHPDAVLYCFRGGLRSQIAQHWLNEVGIPIARVAGGYKALRGFLISTFERLVAASEFTVVGGLTGTGKTDVIRALRNKIDLEGIARHRGSSFGGRAERQPSQIDFENELSIALLKLHHLGIRRMALEDEAHLIGRCAIPLALRQKMKGGAWVWLTAPLEERVGRITRDYIESLHAEYVQAFGPNGNGRFADHLTRSLSNLRKRLGLQRYADLDQLLQRALTLQFQTGRFDLHREWIEPLLTSYYDPMYAYQRSQKPTPALFEGSLTEVIEFLKDRTG